jgi:hypothetical protein
MSQPTPTPPQFADPKSAKAQAKAEKAYRKASRPWFKKKRFILLAVVVLIILIVVISTSGGGNSSSSSSSGGGSASGGGSSSGSAKAAGLNQPVKDGKFQFTVTGEDCTKSTLGNPPLTKKAQGTFCVVSVTVQNIGNQAQLLDASSQYAYDSAGHKFSADSSAAMYMGDTNTFLNQINPGNTVQGQIAYDVPTGTKLTKLELHDSPFSGGADVSLG